MADDRRDRTDLPTSDAAPEDLGARSVLLSLGPDGALEGVSLRELED